MSICYIKFYVQCASWYRPRRRVVFYSPWCWKVVGHG